MISIADREAERLALQKTCDDSKTQAERNRLGQFATPPALALEIMGLAKALLPTRRPVRFLDPAFGTGAFYSAFLEVFKPGRIAAAVGYEIDSHYADKSIALWKRSGLDLRVADFTKQRPPQVARAFNLVVCNPPYVRHHHLLSQDKTRLHGQAKSVSGVSLNGLAGLYCYFLLLTHAWVTEGGLCLWLVPSEFMDVNYGVELKRYLRTKVTLLQIHRFDSNDLQFGDALVSSSVVCFRKSLPPEEHDVKLTFGGSLEKPKAVKTISASTLSPASKWNGRSSRSATNVPTAMLGDIFDIKRGLATGNNEFFILTPERIKSLGMPMDFFRPILPSPRSLVGDEINADSDGNPILERPLFLLDCPLPEAVVESNYPSLWRYLASGKESVSGGYLCRSRSPWYSQENRPAPTFLCTYMGRRGNRATPFRFILNHSSATAANVYLLLYPRAELRRAISEHPEIKRPVWTWLNAICSEAVIAEGRVYGGGLYKIEPKELGKVPADGLAKLLGLTTKRKPIQFEIFSGDPLQNKNQTLTLL
jgi:adenine-specific DNA-methyltransferase